MGGFGAALISNAASAAGMDNASLCSKVQKILVEVGIQATICQAPDQIPQADLQKFGCNASELWPEGLPVSRSFPSAESGRPIIALVAGDIEGNVGGSHSANSVWVDDTTGATQILTLYPTMPELPKGFVDRPWNGPPPACSPLARRAYKLKEEILTIRFRCTKLDEWTNDCCILKHSI